MCVQSCLSLCDPHGLEPTRLLCHGIFFSKNTEVGCHFLFQAIFLTQGSNLSLLHWQADSLPLNHLRILYYCMKVKVKMKSLSHAQLFATPWAVADQAPPSMGFSRQEYCSRWLLHFPGDLPDPGIELESPALAGGFFTTERLGKPEGLDLFPNPPAKSLIHARF